MIALVIPCPLGNGAPPQGDLFIEVVTVEAVGPEGHLEELNREEALGSQGDPTVGPTNEQSIPVVGKVEIKWRFRFVFQERILKCLLSERLQKFPNCPFVLLTEVALEG